MLVLFKCVFIKEMKIVTFFFLILKYLNLEIENFGLQFSRIY